MFAIITHGGAGRWPGDQARAAADGVRAAALAGSKVLAKGGSSLDAVVACVAILEDDPLYNAGTGSALNIQGEVEMDATVMQGSNLRCGGVAAIRGVKNPVLVARKVMEETDHVLLSGPGAERFAYAMGFPHHDAVTSERLAEYLERMAQLKARQTSGEPRLSKLIAAHPDLAQGTVGAVALDRDGKLAAATSTGGVTLKLAGRIGDSPIPGAGNYASPLAACSATGHGELLMRFVSAKAVCDAIASGLPPAKAIEKILVEMEASVGGDAGFIALDKHGRIGVSHLTNAMPHAFYSEGDGAVSARFRVETQ